MRFSDWIMILLIGNDMLWISASYLVDIIERLEDWENKSFKMGISNETFSVDEFVGL